MQMSNRAYSLLEIKALDDSKREITGIATTPTPDRVGDIVEPLGAKFAAELPLLWQHQHDKPVGTVKFDKPTKDGITFRASLPVITESGPLKELVDMAWQAVKAKLVKGVSIGFRPIEYSFLDSGGVRFSETEIYELSLVTIPAQAQATIQTIKSIDSAMRAASGSAPSEPAEKSAPPPGVSGTPKQPANGGFFYTRTKGKEMNVAEQIKALEDKRKELSDERTGIQTKAVEAGRTKDAQEAERFAEITAELSSIDKELADLRVMEKDLIATAKPVDGTSEKGAAESRSPGSIQVRDQRVVGKGLAVAQMARFIAKAQGNLMGAQQLAEVDKQADPRVPLLLKAAVAAGSTSNAAWAGNLVGDETSAYADFIEFLRPQTILGKFGQGGIPSLRPAPFRTALIGQTSGGSGYWVGEGQAKPLTKFDFARTAMAPLKVANIAVVTEEILRDSSPSADAIIRDGLVAALRERLDKDFIDPNKAAVADVSPASILNGVTAIASSGNTADDVRADVQALFKAFIAANNAPTSGVWIMPSTTALALSLMLNPLGQPEFAGISMNGGTLFGLPVIVSEYVPTVTGSAAPADDGAVVALVNASDIYLGDEGGFQLDLSREASLQMSDAPDNPPTATTVMVSLWQMNLVGFRAERTINWAKRRPSAAAYLNKVKWGQ